MLQKPAPLPPGGRQGRQGELAEMHRPERLVMPPAQSLRAAQGLRAAASGCIHVPSSSALLAIAPGNMHNRNQDVFELPSLHARARARSQHRRGRPTGGSTANRSMMDMGRFIRLPPPAPMPGCINMVPAPAAVRQPPGRCQTAVPTSHCCNRWNDVCSSDATSATSSATAAWLVCDLRLLGGLARLSAGASGWA